jgi:hypothetical protein
MEVKLTEAPICVINDQSSILDKDSHTDKKTSSRFRKEKKETIQKSNKYSKSLSMASQAKFDRKKFLGDLVASKIFSSYKAVREQKQLLVRKDS